jgi:hypothetical protein
MRKPRKEITKMFFTLNKVGLDIQTNEARDLKIQFENFIKENIEKKVVDISAFDIYTNASTSISVDEIQLAYLKLMDFCKEHNLLKPELGLTIDFDDPEYSFKLNIEEEYEPHIFWCGINVAILILHFFERINYENNRDEIPDDSWTPPENWSNGTDDEQEAYQTFWEHKSSKGPK